MDAPVELVRFGQPPGPVRPQEGLPDPGVQVIGPGRPSVGRNPVLVLVVSPAYLQAALRGPVFPDQGGVEVAVTEGRIAAEGEAVGRIVGVGLQGVVFVEPVGDAEVGVREARRAAGVGALLRKPLQQPVGIGGARPGDDGGLPFGQRSFHV